MNAIELKQKWKAGQPSPGMWLRLTDPTIVDLIGDVGFDWVMFDAEHVAYDFQTLQNLFIALKGLPTLPFVRVPSNDLVYIKRVLDIGAAGVLVPQIASGTEAAAAVAACKYPPAGVRGAGPRRPSRYGRFVNEYIRTANDQTIVLVMIETISAVRAIDHILAVEGLDGLILGPVDLAASMGLFGDFERSEVREAIDLVIRKARAARVPFGSGQPNDDPTGWLDRGAQLVGIADDEMFIMRGAWRAMERFREITERKRSDVQ